MINFYDLDFEENIAELTQKICHDISHPKSVHFVAMSTLTSLKKDNLLKSFMSENISVCDSRIIQAISRLTGKKLVQIRGTDFLRYFLVSEYRNVKHLFLGSTTSTLHSLQNSIFGLCDKEVSAEFFDPGLIQDVFSDRHIQVIKGYSPDVIWVGLGSPKQDLVAKQLLLETGAWIICVGAAFDFFAEVKTESPNWISRIGMEWLFRLMSEPQRLHKRYRRDFITAIRLILLAICEVFERIKK